MCNLQECNFHRLFFRINRISVDYPLEEVSTTTNYKGNVLSLNTDANFRSQLVVELLHCGLYHYCWFAQRTADRGGVGDSNLRFNLDVSVVANRWQPQ